MCDRAVLLSNLLKEAVAGRLSNETLLERLQREHATPGETSDILDKLSQRRRLWLSRGPGHEDRESHPSGSNDVEVHAVREKMQDGCIARERDEK